MKAKNEKETLVCLPKRLTKIQLIESAQHAIRINPMNRPPVERMAALGKGFAPTPQTPASYSPPASARDTSRSRRQ